VLPDPGDAAVGGIFVVAAQKDADMRMRHQTATAHQKRACEQNELEQSTRHFGSSPSKNEASSRRGLWRNRGESGRKFASQRALGGVAQFDLQRRMADVEFVLQIVRDPAQEIVARMPVR